MRWQKSKEASWGDNTPTYCIFGVLRSSEFVVHGSFRFVSCWKDNIGLLSFFNPSFLAVGRRTYVCFTLLKHLLWISGH